MGNQPIWKRENFLFSLIMIIGVGFGLTTNIANDIIAYLLGIVGLVGNLRLFLKDAKFIGFVSLLKNLNFWAYLLGLVTAISPALATIVPSLQDLFNAIIAKNYGAIITALFALGATIWGLVKNPPKPAIATA
jgi:uncharacterized membrane protein YedE/YeeE